jgi:RNA polymerase sigma factor (TIGR02999 family)
MTSDDITRKLQAWFGGDASALDDLLPFIIANMRAIARRTPKQGATITTTVLVNEAWLRFAGKDLAPSDREHFIALVARAMRQILIDHARTQRRLKRGGGVVHATLTDKVVMTDSQIEELLMIDDLLDRLEAENPRRRQIFEMRFFAGLTVEELAETLHISANTVIRDYRIACAWLRFHFSVAAPSQGAST